MIRTQEQFSWSGIARPAMHSIDEIFSYLRLKIRDDNAPIKKVRLPFFTFTHKKWSDIWFEGSLPQSRFSLSWLFFCQIHHHFPSWSKAHSVRWSSGRRSVNPKRTDLERHACEHQEGRVKQDRVWVMGDSKVIKSLGGHCIDLRLYGGFLLRCVIVIIFIGETKRWNVWYFSVVLDEDSLDVFRK